MVLYSVVLFFLASFTQLNDLGFIRAGCINGPFLCIVERCSVTWIYHNLFTRLRADGH